MSKNETNDKAPSKYNENASYTAIRSGTKLPDADLYSKRQK
jgi:hypothetical protein